MKRCDYCECRFSWDCEDFKVSNDCLCDSFKLDFDTLSEGQKKTIQRILMNIGDTHETNS